MGIGGINKLVHGDEIATIFGTGFTVRHDEIEGVTLVEVPRLTDTQIVDALKKGKPLGDLADAEALTAHAQQVADATERLESLKANLDYQREAVTWIDAVVAGFGDQEQASKDQFLGLIRSMDGLTGDEREEAEAAIKRAFSSVEVVGAEAKRAKENADAYRPELADAEARVKTAEAELASLT